MKSVFVSTVNVGEAAKLLHNQRLLRHLSAATDLTVAA